MTTVSTCWNAILGMWRRAKVVQSRPGTERPSLTVQALTGETWQGVPLLLPHGMTALPNPGADVLVVALNGSSDVKLALHANDPANLIGDVGPGELGFRAHGRQIVLRAGSAQILADGETLRRVVTEVFIALFNNHTHGGGPKPDQAMGDAHLTATTQLGGP